MADTSKDPALAQLCHFLYFGDATKTDPKSISFPFTSEKIQSILENSGSEQDAIREIVRFYRDGHYLSLEPMIYALAVFAHSKNMVVKSAAYEAAREICVTALSLFCFVHFSQQISKPTKGWGRGMRKFASSWYTSKDPKDLAIEVTKVKSLYKWTHKDVLCMSHIKSNNPAVKAVLHYLIKKFDSAEKEFSSEPEAEEVLRYLKAIHDLNFTQDAETAARLFETYDLCLDHVPTKFLKTKEVALCLISRVPIKNLLALLPSFCKYGLLKLNSPHYRALLERLGSEETLNDPTVDPLESFLAIRRWQLSNRIPGKSMMRQNTPAIDDALQNLHLASFKSVIPTQKRYLVAVDIRPFMSQSVCGGCKCVTPSNVCEIAVLALVKAELSNVTVLVFSPEELVQVDINNKMTISDVNEHLNKVMPGDVNLCSVPQWALTKKKLYDILLVLTDSFNGTYHTGWVEAFKEYKDTLNLPNTRYIVASLADSSLAAVEDDPFMLNVIGFNVKLLKIIQDFACGVF